LTPGRAYHVVCEYDGAHAQLYVDGKLETSITATGTLDYSAILANMGLAIGGALGSQEPIFNGTISDVAVYPSTLSAADIANHYAVGAVSAPTATPAPAAPAYTSLILASNPLAYYKLDDGNATLTDSGPQKITGAYGAGVARKTAALTSANDPSATFPGSPAGADVAANSVTVAANNVFTQPTTGLSVEAWVKPADYNRTGDYVPVVSYGRQVIGSAWAIQLTPQSTLTFYLKVVGGSYLLTPSATLLPGQTYHVVATYDGSRVSLFLNGGLATSTAGHGAINYAGIAPQYGLSIGGALGGALPIFNGTINDVAIYPSALSTTAIEKHYMTGEIAVPVQEMPLASNAFVDTIGVVTHLRASNTPYTNSWSTFQTLIKASGIRHIGDTLISTPVGYAQHVLALAANGIHASLITNLNQTAGQIRSAIATFSPAIEAVEGPNEPDIIGDPNWVSDTRTFQSMLWSTVKSDGATSTLTVVGPSMVSLGDDLGLGNLASAMDDGSIHDYFDGYNPGTSGWGSLSSYGIYGSIAYNIAISAPVSGSHPALSTETGYSSSPSDTEGVDSRTLARYIPRIFLEHYLHGIARTTLYEFYDEPGTGAFANFGLVTASNAPKSSYYALTSLIATLNDQGSSFTPTPLRYLLTGNMNNVHHLLLQRRDGTYQLVMWVEVAGYDPLTKADVTVPPQAVTLAPANGATSGSIATIGDDGKLITSAITFTNGVASFNVDDRVAIVSFK
jgi:hypothetical protein